MSTDNSRPNTLQYIAYSYGRELPPSMGAWVRNDVAGRGAQRRTLLRVTLPALLVIAPLWLIPTTLAIHLAMTAILLLPFLYFTFALDKVWRTYRLRQHGLDPAYIDELAHKRDAKRIETYHRNYGRPEGFVTHAS